MFLFSFLCQDVFVNSFSRSKFFSFLSRPLFRRCQKLFDRVAFLDIVSVPFEIHIVLTELHPLILYQFSLKHILCLAFSRKFWWVQTYQNFYAKFLLFFFFFFFFCFFFLSLCLNTPVREMSVYFTGPSFECIPRRTFVTDSSILTVITSSRGRFYITSRRRNPEQRQTEKTRTACTSLQSNCGSSYFPQIFSTFGTSNRGQQRNLLRQYSSARYYLLQNSV